MTVSPKPTAGTPRNQAPTEVNVVSALIDQIDARVPTDITGVLDAGRFLGATASGPPTTGTHLLYDFVIDGTGTVWICILAGTPGTWVDVSSGRELDRATKTTTEQFTGTTPNDVDGLSVTFEARNTRPIFIAGFCVGALNNTATARTENLRLTDGAGTLVSLGKMFMAASSLSGSVYLPYILDPVAETEYTFKLQCSGSNAGSDFTVQAGATFPMYLFAVEH